MSNQPVPVVDAHHHLWDLSQEGKWHWLEPGVVEDHIAGDLQPIRKSYLVKDFAADAASAGVTKSVHLQAEFDNADPVGETRWLQSIADSHQQGFPHGIVAKADLSDPDVDEVLAEHCKYANVRGIRHMINWDPERKHLSFTDKDQLNNPDWLRGFALLHKHGLSFDLQIYHWQAADAARIAREHRETSIILNHCAIPYDRDDDSVAKWREAIRTLAAEPNITAKISGLGMTDHKWTTDSIRPFVLHMIESFGVDRCMFASNFPVDKLMSDYATLYQAYRDIVADLPRADQEALFGGNAVRIYRL